MIDFMANIKNKKNMTMCNIKTLVATSVLCVFFNGVLIGAEEEKDDSEKGAETSKKEISKKIIFKTDGGEEVKVEEEEEFEEEEEEAGSYNKSKSGKEQEECEDEEEQADSKKSENGEEQEEDKDNKDSQNGENFNNNNNNNKIETQVIFNTEQNKVGEQNKNDMENYKNINNIQEYFNKFSSLNDGSLDEKNYSNKIIIKDFINDFDHMNYEGAASEKIVNHKKHKHVIKPKSKINCLPKCFYNKNGNFSLLFCFNFCNGALSNGEKNYLYKYKKQYMPLNLLNNYNAELPPSISNNANNNLHDNLSNHNGGGPNQ